MNKILNVMVIDDHPLQTTLLSHALRKHGASVMRFNSVDHAITCATAGDIDVIFCDIMMPGKDGIDMMELLHQIEYKGKVVLVSAMELTIISALQAMCAEFSFDVIGKLQKPFKSADIAKIIRQMKQETEGIASSSPAVDIQDQDFLFALGKDQVKNYYQPLVNMKTGETEGYEALARWIHPDFGVLTPYYFLSTVERCQLSSELFEAVFSGVISDMQSHSSISRVSINVDHNNLADRHFATRFLQRCRDFGTDPSRLTIEITERDAFQANAVIYKNLLKLRLNRVTVSIDDFGTGFSSFEKLAQLPFNELKIDRSLVTGVSSDLKKQNIVIAICALAKSLGIKVVAEGIEDEITLRTLRGFGIDLCQGFYFDKPMPLEAI
ncbi:EAL domain-containing response regulator [Vibrio mytili]|uniref:Diguanylate phosphodiesterase n=1 Tax=Vibrio mytili TaxID=50718 RepID=A0A0C3EBP3_9VIBR|nr:EAL domain-containing response regulator [Vibrio mytili]KIN11863.1 diguanylate phosphodiesterase [Vibrio mytili]